MLINQLANKIFSADCLQHYLNKINSNKDATLSVSASIRPIIIACQFAINPRPSVVVVPGDKNAQLVAKELRWYLGINKVYEYFEAPIDTFDPVLSGRRSVALHHLINGDDCVVVLSSNSLLRKFPDKAKGFCEPIKIVQGGEYDFNNLIEDFIKMGYRQYEVLEGPGTFVIRGGIIDIFPSHKNYPVRLDFFGDEIDEIRRIVRSSGQTTNAIENINIYPAVDLQLSQIDINRANINLESRARTNKQIREYLEKIDNNIAFNEIYLLEPYIFENMVSISSLITKNTTCFICEPRAVIDGCKKYFEDLSEKFKDTSFTVDDYYTHPDKIEFGEAQCCNLVSIMQTGIASDSKLKVKRPTNHKNVEHLATILKNYYKNGFTTILSVPNTRARADIKQDLVGLELSINEVKSTSNDANGDLMTGVVNIIDVPVSLPFVIPDSKVAVLSLVNGPIMSQNIMRQNSLMYSTESEIENSVNNSSLDYEGRMAHLSTYSSRYIDITKITFPYKPGDYVVHSYHGIAKFVDLVRRNLNGIERDYLLLEYADEDKLYVPIEQLGRVTRYVGPQGSKPRITKLGSADWSRALSKARKATRKMAFDLVDVYSRREMAHGHAFGKDSQAQSNMENDFEYVETFDQMQAISDVKTDMESERPMDRLICGDVGFGKTEVAIRAAFKCVDGGMQVMVLCPTTILASQHFSTFNSRLKPYGVKCEVLSRFKTESESKKIIEKLNNGELDVLIGTHRLLSRDINPKNLGLIIVDEEQRFGVAHKEQLKNFRESVDVLTLSATPIPRTMQMATSGVRDMSLILTPPDHRLAVEVHVGQWDIDIVSEAIQREMQRGGQVYYVSNRVKTIKDAVARVGLSAGEVKIGVAHGQMQKSQLESIMEDFNSGKIDVLVSTTIIESGIDNPNTNTLIVEDAQNLGLAQMYQLKGRVGRSTQQAYAYFLVSDSSLLNEEAVARLNAIDELSDLGSGVQIALRDLEIRGAGNFLGAEQSGNMSGVGFDLFAQMLKGAVENAQKFDSDSKNDNTDEDYLAPSISDIAVNIPGSAYLPDDYIRDVDQRVIWYRRLACAQSIDEVYAIESDLLECNDAIPKIAKNLLLKSRIAGLAMKYGIKLVSVNRGKLILEGRELTKKQINDLRLIAGTYLSLKKQISIPIRRISTESDDPEQKSNLFADIFEFMDNLDL